MYDTKLFIENNGVIYSPALSGEVVWETQRCGAPGVLTFNVVNDNYQNTNIDFSEGNKVAFYFNEKPVFLGYVFTKERNKEQIISVKAYDQLRYLNARESYIYEGKTASELIKMIAADFKLNFGNIENTGVKISRIEDNAILFDIILNALSETKALTGKEYVLYDDFGRLCLKNIQEMDSFVIIDEDTSGDFYYSSSIDNMANRVKLIHQDRRSGIRDVFVEENQESIKKYGVLQYFSHISDSVGAKEKCKGLISSLNKVQRNLKVKDVLGDISLRGGMNCVANLTLGDVNAKGFYVADFVKHRFFEGGHLMDVVLKGGVF